MNWKPREGETDGLKSDAEVAYQPKWIQTALVAPRREFFSSVGCLAEVERENQIRYGVLRGSWHARRKRGN